jgi:hypothetical protein
MWLESTVTRGRTSARSLLLKTFSNLLEGFSKASRRPLEGLSKPSRSLTLQCSSYMVSPRRALRSRAAPCRSRRSLRGQTLVSSLWPLSHNFRRFRTVWRPKSGRPCRRAHRCLRHNESANSPAWDTDSGDFSDDRRVASSRRHRTPAWPAARMRRRGSHPRRSWGGLEVQARARPRLSTAPWHCTRAHRCSGPRRHDSGPQTPPYLNSCLVSICLDSFFYISQQSMRSRDILESFVRQN